MINVGRSVLCIHPTHPFEDPRPPSPMLLSFAYVVVSLLRPWSMKTVSFRLGDTQFSEGSLRLLLTPAHELQS